MYNKPAQRTPDSMIVRIFSSKIKNNTYKVESATNKIINITSPEIGMKKVLPSLPGYIP